MAASKEIDGVEMGVLSDGTAYLSGRGLAAVCGVVPSAIIALSGSFTWGEATTTRNKKLQYLLAAQGYDKDALYFDLQHDGQSIHACPPVG